MKRVLLTGGSGSVGVHFIAHIMHNTDWDIVNVGAYRHRGSFDKIATVCEDHPNWVSRIQNINHDLTAPFTEREVKKLGNIDYILNLASLSDVQASIDDPVPFVRNNVELVLTMLELARILNPKVFLQFSTDEAMGPAARDQAHKEWDPILPSNPYAASKAAQEAIAISYWRSYDVPLVITNTMNNASEMQQSNKFPVIVQKKVMAGEEVQIHTASNGDIGTRYYIHSRTAADAVLFILKNTDVYHHKPGEVDRPDRYNIVGDAQLSNLELAQLIAGYMKKELKYKLVNFHESNPGHDINYGLDGKKLADLGWKPPMPFKESLKNIIDWQLDHPEWIS
jgi:dTDP-glucose 4,6-dehydratase